MFKSSCCTTVTHTLYSCYPNKRDTKKGLTPTTGFNWWWTTFENISDYIDCISCNWWNYLRSTFEDKYNKENMITNLAHCK